MFEADIDTKLKLLEQFNVDMEMDVDKMSKAQL